MASITSLKHSGLAFFVCFGICLAIFPRIVTAEEQSNSECLSIESKVVTRNGGAVLEVCSQCTRSVSATARVSSKKTGDTWTVSLFAKPNDCDFFRVGSSQRISLIKASYN